MQTFEDFISSHYLIKEDESSIDISDIDNEEEHLNSLSKTKKHLENIRKRAVSSEELPAVYSNLNADPVCIFKHIIFFTNDRSNANKTLKILKEAIKALKTKPELHVFVTTKMTTTDDGSVITLDDGIEKMVIKDQDNLDTLVFSRLSVNGEEDVEHIVRVLQDRGFLVLNPVRAMQLASNKYESACLFEKGNIPQPRFCLMKKDILYDKKKFNSSMKRIYDEWSDDEESSKDLKIVMKILNGHGGCGVSVLTGKELVPVLQTIFAIDPDRQMLLQRKEEADGGDIRVHVLTMKTKQVILGAMKRSQISGDFRSNVSLGAKAGPVKLTHEQEQIALKTAAISGLPWCGVDIMPLKKGSNKELGDNAVIEINASPGTEGITEVLGHNFINVLLNELTDPSEFLLQEKTAGYIEACNIDFGDGVSKDFLAKLDTGNSTSANTLEVGEYTEENNKIIFSVNDKKLTFEKAKIIRAVVGDRVYSRPVIIVPYIKIGLRRLSSVPIAIVKSRNHKTTNILLCRDTLSKLGYNVSPSRLHILTKEMEKVHVI